MILVRRASAALLVAVALLCVTPSSPAGAHATLLFTTPTVDSSTATSPRVIQLVFDEEVLAARSAIRIMDETGREKPTGAVTGLDDGLVLRTNVRGTLDPGSYTVRWEAGADDGDLMTGEFHFVVGSETGVTSMGSGSGTGDTFVTTVSRWLTFLGLAVALGGLVGERIVRKATAGKVLLLAPRRPWVLWGTAIGLFAALIGLLAYVLNGPVGFVDRDVLNEVPARVLVIEVLVFVIAGALRLLSPRGGLIIVVLLVVPLAEGFRAHPAVASPGFGIIVTAVHLAAAAMWVGALVHVTGSAVALRKQGEAAAPLFAEYARWALALFVLVVISGTASVAALGPQDSLRSISGGEGWGRWFLLKLLAVAVIAALAVAGRRTLRQRRLRPTLRSARAEFVVLVAVVALSAAMTVAAPPRGATAALPFAPPATGATVSAGTRAGEIGIAVAASDGQIVLRLSTPSRGQAQSGQPGVGDYRLSVTVRSDGTIRARRASLRLCGDGCFVAPIDWLDGRSTVDIRAAARGWTGGTAAVNINWPFRDGTDVLRRTVETMKDTRRLVLYEQVTSNTKLILEAPRPIDLDGPEFLQSQPYGNGAAPSVGLVGRAGGDRTLALTYPAESIFVLLTIDDQYRITTERTSTPKHVVTRTLAYNMNISSEGSP